MPIYRGFDIDETDDKKQFEIRQEGKVLIKVTTAGDALAWVDRYKRLEALQASAPRQRDG